MPELYRSTAAAGASAVQTVPGRILVQSEAATGKLTGSELVAVMGRAATSMSWQLLDRFQVSDAEPFRAVDVPEFWRLDVSGNGGGAEIAVSASFAGRVVGLGQAGFAAAIASGGSLSDAVDLGDLRAVRIVMPAAWTAAALTFQTSYDGTAFNDLYDEAGAEVSYTVAAGRSVRLPVGDWLGVRFLKLRSGTTGTPVNQAAARSFIVVAQG